MAKMYGPISSSSEDLFKEGGDPNDLKVGKGVWGGEPGFPAESKGKIPTLIYEETGQFGDPKKAE